MKKRFKYMLPAMISLLIGAFFLFAGVKLWWKGDSDADWPTTTGVLTDVELVSEPAVNRGSETRTAGFQWRLSVKYEYVLNDKKYDGKRLTNVSGEKIRYDKKDQRGEAVIPKDLAKIYHDLKKQTQVTVHYRPSMPSYSYLIFEKPSTVRNLVFLLIGFMFFFPGVLLMWKALVD